MVNLDKHIGKFIIDELERGNKAIEQRTQKIDTLHFILEKDYLRYSVSDLMIQITEQRANFYKEFGYYPDYINIPYDVLIFLEKNVDQYSPEFGKGIHTIYGMKVVTRKDYIVEALFDREVICTKEIK